MKKIVMLQLAVVIVAVIALTAFFSSSVKDFFAPETVKNLKNVISSEVSKAESEISSIQSEVSSQAQAPVSSQAAPQSSSTDKAASPAPQPAAPNPATQVATGNTVAAPAAQNPAASTEQKKPQPAPVEPVTVTPPAAPPSTGAAPASTVTTNYWGQTGITGLKVYEYGKSLLGAGEQDCYQQIADAVQNLNSSFTVKTGLDPVTVEKIVSYYLSDHPELFYFESCAFSYSYSSGASGQIVYISYTFSFSYLYDKNTVSVMRDKISLAAAPILSKANLLSTDYDKEKSLHDSLVSLCNYNMSAVDNPSAYPQSFTAYGALAQGSAVCEGYAKAMKLLLDSAGIQSLYVTGTAESGGESGSHAWNMVKVSGKWYYLDATFDDPVYVTSSGQYVSSNQISYTYFNYITKSDHQLGTFNASNPFADSSQNYAQMPTAG